MDESEEEMKRMLNSVDYLESWFSDMADQQGQKDEVRGGNNIDNSNVFSAGTHSTIFVISYQTDSRCMFILYIRFSW